MTQETERRRSYPFSLQLDYWSPCVDPRLAVNGVRIAQTRHPYNPFRARRYRHLYVDRR